MKKIKINNEFILKNSAKIYTLPKMKLVIYHFVVRDTQKNTVNS